MGFNKRKRKDPGIKHQIDLDLAFQFFGLNMFFNQWNECSIFDLAVYFFLDSDSFLQ